LLATAVSPRRKFAAKWYCILLKYLDEANRQEKATF